MSATKYKKGVSLLFVVLIMGVILAISLGISAILVQQIKMMKEIGYSVIAFYAADTGIEDVLMDRENPSSSCTQTTPCSLDNGAEYYIQILAAGGDCSANNFCIKSIGKYQETKRAIEISY